MVLAISGMVVVNSADRQTMLALLFLIASTNFSGGTFTPRSVISPRSTSSMMGGA